MQTTSVRAVLERLASVLGTKTANSLADALGVSPQAISSWKSRESVPYAQCVEIAVRHQVSLDWLLRGEGAMLKGQEVRSDDAGPENPREQAILALFRSLDEDAQRAVQDVAEEKKRVRELETRLKELAAELDDAKKMA